MEDVEDVIVSSGPERWPNWRNFSIASSGLRARDHRPRGAHLERFKSCCYRT